MKVLHYLFGLPPVRTGGLFRYAIDLMHGEQQAGIEVCMLVPGPIRFSGNKSVSLQRQRLWHEIVCYRIVNPLYIPNAYGMKEPNEFMRPASISTYKRWLENIDLDIIHIHSFMGLHYEFIQAANILKIPIIYTTHDFFGLCPITTLLCNGRICSGNDWTRCSQCSSNAYSLKRLWLEQTDLYRLYLKSELLTNVFRSFHLNRKKEQITDVTVSNQSNTEKKYRLLQAYYRSMFDGVTFFHYNSYQTKKIFDSLLGVRKGKTVLISNNTIADRRVKRSYGKVLRIGYLGGVMPLKGYEILKDALKKLFDDGKRDFVLNVYSPVKDVSEAFIRWHRPYSQNELPEVFDNMDVLVVPSLCNETFGMVVPEALSFGMPVIVSERVGAKALLEAFSGIGIIFKLIANDLYNQLEKIYTDRSILASCNQKILDSELSFDFRLHVSEMLEIYKTNLVKGRT